MQTQLSGNPCFEVQCAMLGDINRSVIHFSLLCCLGQNHSVPSVTSQVNESCLIYTQMIPLEPLLCLFHTVQCSHSHEAPFVLAPAVPLFYFSDFSSLGESVVWDTNKIFFKLWADFTHDFQSGCCFRLVCRQHRSRASLW